MSACQLVGLSICWEVGERGFRGWRLALERAGSAAGKRRQGGGL